jgi:hypothetical protein
MLKRYKSKSCVSINVVLPTGGNTHVSFSPVTGGGSVYYTDNENIQKGLERHPKYGRLFVIDTVASAQKPVIKKQGTVAEKAAAGQQPTESAVKKAVEVKMACNDDAKDYVADKFGVSRSKMRSRADIEKVATENGVKIIWV